MTWWSLKEPRAQVPGLGLALDGSVAASCLHREDSPSPMKCLGLPRGPKLPFQEKLSPVQAHRPSPPTPQPMGLQEMEARKALSTTPAPRPAWSRCSVSARRWLHSWLCPVTLHPPLSGSAAGRPDYLSNAQNLRMGCSPTPPPTQGQRAVLQSPQSRCCPTCRGPSCGPTEAWLPSRKPAGLALEVDIPLLL